MEEGSVEYLFGSISSAALSADGTIYVVDSEASLVRRYDVDGRYIGILGGVGDGPGEYRKPTFIALAENGRIVVAEEERGNVHSYSPDGTAENRVSFGFPLDHPLLADDEYTYVRPKGLHNERQRWAGWPERITGSPLSVEVIRGNAVDVGILRIDASGGIDTIPPPALPPEPGPYHAIVGRTYYGITYRPKVWWSFFPPRTFLRGSNDQYSIEIIELNGAVASGPRETRRISREVEPLVIPEGLREVLRQQLEAAENNRLCQTCATFGFSDVPAVTTAYHRVYPVATGGLWVMRPTTSEEFVDADGETAWRETESVFDIYDRMERYVGTVTGPVGLVPMFIRGDTLLARTRSPSGIHAVTRFIVNWQSGD